MKIESLILKPNYYDYRKNNNLSTTKIDKNYNDTFELSFNGAIAKRVSGIGEEFAQKIISKREKKPSFMNFLKGCSSGVNDSEPLSSTAAGRFIEKIALQRTGNSFVISNEDIHLLCNLKDEVLDVVRKIYPKYKKENTKISDIIKLAGKYCDNNLADEVDLLTDSNYMRGYLSSLGNIDNRLKYYKTNYKFLNQLISAKTPRGEDFYQLDLIDGLLENDERIGKKIHDILTMKNSEGELIWGDVKRDTKRRFIDIYGEHEKEIDKLLELKLEPYSCDSLLSGIIEHAQKWKRNSEAYDYVVKNVPELLQNNAYNEYISNENYKALVDIWKNNEGNKNIPISTMIDLYKINEDGAKYYLGLKRCSGVPVFKNPRWSSNILKKLISEEFWNNNNKELVTKLSKNSSDFENALHFDDPLWKFYSLLHLNNKNPELVAQVMSRYPNRSFTFISDVVQCANKYPEKTLEFLDKKILGKRLDKLEGSSALESLVRAYTKDPVFTKEFIHAEELDKKNHRLRCLNFSQCGSLEELVDATSIDSNFVDKIIYEHSDDNSKYLFDIFDSKDLLGLTKKYQNPELKEGIDHLLQDKKMSLYDILQKIKDYEEM